MKRPILALVFLLFLLGGALWWLVSDQNEIMPGKGSLLVHCGAGMRKPMNEIARQYEEEFGVKIILQFGGSGALESQLEVAGGDLYLPADQSYLESIRSKGLLRESMPVTRLSAGIVVPKGNPKRIAGLQDLGREAMKVSLGEKSASVGKYTWKVLEQENLLGVIEPNVIVTKPTVNMLVEDVAMGAVDASIAWDAVAGSFPEVEWIPVPEFTKRSKLAGIGVLTASKNVTRALHFARYVTSRDRGRKVFVEMGFEIPDEGDVWADIPKVTLFSGSMLRPAIQEKVREFEKREGCRINTIFEGCGTLVGMMKAGSKPAGYFSCDVKFLEMVHERFFPGTVMTGNEIVLLVRKGNPKSLSSLDDLSKEGVKLGVCDETKSALGQLTHQLLTRRKVSFENVMVKVAKGDDLVSAMQARSLDAALIYRSNALASPVTLEECEIVELNDELAFAEQPYAVARETGHAELMKRLGELLSSGESKKDFERLGFTWKLESTK